MKENIKKNLLFTILVFLSLTIHAQKYQGSIVNAENQQSLPAIFRIPLYLRPNTRNFHSIYP